MELKILGSSSKGNCYVLETEDEILLIEAGVSIKDIMIGINFKVDKMVGCIVTHEHMDHARSILDLLRSTKVCMSRGTGSALNLSHPNLNIITGPFSLGMFTIYPFKVEHDAVEPLGFLIDHHSSGRILFLTDTFYCKYKFEGLNQVIIEANYCNKILERKQAAGSTKKIVRDRVFQSHMSLDTCKDFLKANDLTAVHNIVLIHLSDAHSDEAIFKKEVEQLTHKKVIVAKPRVKLSFNKTPF